jgi:hypothetical protein
MQFPCRWMTFRVTGSLCRFGARSRVELLASVGAALQEDQAQGFCSVEKRSISAE